MKMSLNVIAVVLPLLPLVIGCGSQEKEERDFFTSGNREADQRAEQRVARDEQINPNEEVQARTLYEKLGGEEGINMIVNDWVARMLNDPRVNFHRTGVETGGFLNVGETSVEWKPTAGDIASLKTHFVQFLSLASGGPTKYSGRDMKAVHSNMKITNAQFDASVGDLQATLDKLNVRTDEQKELLAIVESTRPQIVEER